MDTTDESPEDVHPDLTPDRLHMVGMALADARDAAQNGSKKSLGDDQWVVGCTAYARGRHEITRLAELNPGWLAVVNPGMEFLFRVGMVPVRFYHVDSEAPAVRHSHATLIERETLQRLFKFDDGGSGAEVFRLAVKTDEKGLTSSVSLIRALGRDVTGAWEIWARAASATTPRSAGKELPPPTVRHLDDEPAADQERATGTEDGA